ncbi:MAG: hypothetical protein ABII00_12670 [Elusimicrobiota bacterium]
MLYEILPASLAAKAVTILVSRFTKPPEQAAQDIDAVKGQVVEIWPR